MNTKELEKIQSEVDRLSFEIQSIKTRLGKLISQAKLEISSPSSFEQKESVASTPSQSITENLSAHTSSTRTPSFSATSSVLGSIAILCFVLAASYLVKLAFDSGWLTPQRQVGLAAALGISLILIGVKYFKQTASSYWSLLSASGTVILFLTSYAGYFFHHFYNEFITVVLLSGVSLLCLILFKVFNQIAFILVAIVGSYSINVLVPSLKTLPLDSVLVFVLWDLLYITISVLLRNRSILILSAFLAIGSFGIFHPASRFLYSASVAELTHATVFEFFQFVLFAGATAFFSTRNQMRLTSAEAWAHFPLFFLFYGIEYRLLWEWVPDLAPWFSIGFALLIYLCYFFVKNRLKEPSVHGGPMVAGIISVLLFHALYLRLIPTELCPWFGIAVLLALPFISRKLDLSRRFFLVGIIIYLVIGCEYLRTLSEWSNIAPTLGWWVVNISFSAILISAYLLKNEKKHVGTSIPNGLILSLGNLQAVFGIYRLVHLSALKFNFSNIEQFVTSFAWGLFALSILCLGYKRKDKTLAYSSLLVLALCILKVFVFDVATAQPLVRIGCLLILGVVLYLGGLFFQRVREWEEKVTPV